MANDPRVEKHTDEVTSMGDIKKVVELQKQGKLVDLVAKLNPEDIRGTLNEVPAEVVRLTVALLSATDVDRALREYSGDRRRTLGVLLQSSRKYKGEEFVKALIKEWDDDIRERLGGVDIASGDRATRADKTENPWTSLEIRPELMLRTSKLYCMVAFFRDEELLFRSDIEIDDLLWTARAFLQAANQTLVYANRNASGTKVNIDLPRCQGQLKEIRRLVREIPPSLREIIPQDAHRNSQALRTKRAKKSRD